MTSILSLGHDSAIDVEQVGPVECSEHFTIVGKVRAAGNLEHIVQQVVERRLGGSAQQLMPRVGPEPTDGVRIGESLEYRRPVARLVHMQQDSHSCKEGMDGCKNPPYQYESKHSFHQSNWERLVVEGFREGQFPKRCGLRYAVPMSVMAKYQIALTRHSRTNLARE